MKCLEKRGGVWKYRRMIPEHLRPILGGAYQIIRSLNTKDEATAHQRFYKVKAEMDRIFAEAEVAAKNPEVRAYKLAMEGGTGPWEDHVTSLIEDGHPESDLFRAVLKYRQTTPEGEDNPPLSILFDRYFTERKVTAKTETEWRKVLRCFVDLHGDLPVRAVTQRHVRDFKSALLSTPSARTGKVVSPATAKKTLGGFRAVLQWALRNGYAERNVADGVSQVTTKDTGERSRRSFTDAEVRTLLERSVTDLSEQDRWLLRILLYSGMRLGEGAGLRPEDVKLDRFLVTPHATRRLKNASSQRTCPRHGALADLVWPGPMPSSAAGKRLNRFVQRIIGENRVVHEARHTLISKLRAASVPTDIVKQIVGHSSGDVHSRYGSPYPNEVLLEAIRKVTFD